MRRRVQRCWCWRLCRIWVVVAERACDVDVGVCDEMRDVSDEAEGGGDRLTIVEGMSLGTFVESENGR